MSRWLLASLIVVIVIAFSGRADGQIGNASHSDRAHHFQVKAAPRWFRGNEERISDENEFQEMFNPWRTWTVTQVWQRSSSAESAYPYILLEVTEHDISSMSFADIEKAFDAQTRNDLATAQGQPLAQLIRKLTDSRPVLDRQRKRLVEYRSDKDDDGKAFNTVEVGFLGKACAVHLTLVCDAKNLENYLPEFQEFVDGFKWDSGWEYTPPSGPTSPEAWAANRTQAQYDQLVAEDAKNNRSSSRSSGSTVRFGRGRIYGFGGIGLGVAIVVGIIVRVMMRE